MLPQVFLERMKEQLGGEYQAFLESYDRERHQALRLNIGKKTEGGESMEQALTALFHLERVPWAGNGFYYDGAAQPGKHPYHQAGLYYIQEPSAMAPVEFLKPRPGEKILDLCAAPGGKSTQIGACLKGQGVLVCNEINPARAKILSENVERMGLTNACVTNETPQRLSEVFPEYFDGILVDAPCSGEGMFIKNEIALTEWSPENVQLCGERQDEILDCAAEMLRPGGRLVYSTCTFSEWENEGSIRRFLQRHEEFEPAGELSFHNGERELRFSGMLRLYPHQLKGEGHFLAVLYKKGEVPRDWESRAATGRIQGVGEKELTQWREFARETIKGDPEEALLPGMARVYFKFGDNLYLAPADFPGLKGLKVLRPGLHLGELKKNRFEPSHALALALGMEEVTHAYNLQADSGQAQDYLGGQTFPAEGEKGWHLICVDGISLGWGKLAGGMMKNHYPKGLRRN